jgi:sulfur transfer protein SufE
MSSRPGRLDDVIEMLAFASDPADRADMLLDLAGRFRDVPASVAERPFGRSHQVPSCESEAYVWGVVADDGTMALHFAVENPSGVSAKALAVILDRALSGLRPEEISRVSPEIVFDIFRRDISMGKGLGLMSMVRAVQATARQAADLSRADPKPRIFPVEA